MAAVSLGKAFGSGFALIRERPASVFVWGLMFVLLVQAPVLYLMGTFFSDMFAAFSRLGPAMTPEQANAFALDLQRRMLPAQAATLPAYLVRVLIAAAVYRAVLEPEKRSFASMRIGKQEGWLLLLMLASIVLLSFALIPVYIVVGIGVLCIMLLKAPFTLIGAVVILAGVLTVVWAVARLSLAGPMTFDEREFRLFEAWRVTRGQSLRLVLLALLLLLLGLLVELVVVGLCFAAVIAVAGGWPIEPKQIWSWVAGLGSLDLGRSAIWLVPAALVAAALNGAMTAIWVAPWASAYQQLTTRPIAGA